MPREKKRDYEVGYGKPPRETRFQKGQFPAVDPAARKISKRVCERR